jgi:putative methylase
MPPLRDGESDPPLRDAALGAALERLDGFARPSARREQLRTPTELAVQLLVEARQRQDLRGRSVADLGAGPGTLAIGAALCGARPVHAVEIDEDVVDVLRRNAESAEVSIEAIEGPVEQFDTPVDVVVMNPPFGAQLRHADRPFWAAAFRVARRRIYAFALADSRTFIARLTVDSGGGIDGTIPVRWPLAATLPHHRKARVELEVDLWIVTPRPNTP